MPFNSTVTIMPAPWNANSRLMHVAIKGFDVQPAARPKANLVFLLDVSGSMMAANKLPLVKRAMNLLVENMRDNDRIAIVVYAAHRPDTTDEAFYLLEGPLGATGVDVLIDMSASKGVAANVRTRATRSLARIDVRANASAAAGAFLDLKAAVTGRDDKAIIAEVERGEDYLKEKFETALNSGHLSGESRAAVERAYQSVRSGHDQMSQLKHSMESGTTA